VADEDQKELSSRAYDILVQKIKSIEAESLRNLIVNHTLDFASTPEQLSQLKEFLASKSIPLQAEGTSHELTKLQRYNIIRKIFSDKDVPLEEKNKVLGEEMAVDYSDVDENNKIKCLACIPHQQNKDSLWNQYVKKENMTQEQFSYSSSCFYNNSNKG